MESKNELAYELWWRKGKADERKVAAFHFRHHAEHFLEVLPFTHKEDFQIINIVAE